jgi:hypothetical protein
MALTRYKRELLRRIELINAEFAIQKEDITYIVSQAWTDSFARVATNKKAFAERGWGPFITTANYIQKFRQLVTDKELEQTTCMQQRVNQKCRIWTSKIMVC